MRVLFTSDWQASYDNLNTLQTVVDEILELKKKYDFSALVHCGDVKQVYNPVDIRVVNFVLKSFAKFKQEGLDCYIDLGNHDRVGMHVDKQNWFPVLRRAGALAFDEPKIVGVSGGRLHFLPFRTDPVLLRIEASKLAATADKNQSVLVFHSDLSGAKYNVLTRSEGKITNQDLVSERYLYCVGGHIHLPQKAARNIYYVGSPCAGEWGEANQKKGYLLLDFTTKTLTRVLSRIPGWYDPSWPTFEESKPASWKGTRIRLKVPVGDVRRVAEELRNAKASAEKKYQGAEIVAVPTFQDSDQSSFKIKTDWTDGKKIESYVGETLPAVLEPYRKKTVAYLLDALGQAGSGLRDGVELRIARFSGQNFLSFERLDWPVQKGLFVITGKNKDWNRSNGAGKTSFLQPLAVATFGTTFKGQKHDGWVRRGIDKKQPAWVGVSLLDSQQRQVTILRRRQPRPQLFLKVNGELVDSGNRPDQTQKSIEQITGYTWETLSNAIYIDQSRAHLMLTGKEGERKDFLARLQNLERFERAKKIVKDQRVGYEATVTKLENNITVMTEGAAGVAQTITQITHKNPSKGSPEAAYKVALRDLAQAEQELADWNLLAARRRSTLSTVWAKQQTIMERLQLARLKRLTEISHSRDRVESFKGLESECPTCTQPVDRNKIHKHIAALGKSLQLMTVKLTGLDASIAKLKDMMAESSKKVREWDRNRELESSVQKKDLALTRAQIELDQFKRDFETIQQLQDRRSEMLLSAEEDKKKLEKVKKWLSILDYAESVFSRSGLPAYLNAQLVPELNQSADEYSELFAQKEIQVRFAVDEEGRMDVKVVNAHGGEEVHDQSEGEMKMASLITSFAVRRAAPKTNILILDEPGDGLDPVSARQFARGLLQLKDKFCTILCVTHNPSILSELGEEKLITIVKENGVSRVE